MLGIDCAKGLAACFVAVVTSIACSGDEFVAARKGDGGPGSGGQSAGGSNGNGGANAGAGGATAGAGGAHAGAGGTSGASGQGGTAGNVNAGGTAGSSPGTVTLVLEVGTGKTYCDNVSGGCGIPLAVTHITVSDAAKNPLSGTPILCSIDCATCIQLPCPGGGPGVPGCGYSTPFTGATSPWDGGYTAVSTCGANVSCTERRYAPPGQYIAVMCATPGHMEKADTGEDVCVNTGPVECVEVPFEYPGGGTVTGTLGN